MLPINRRSKRAQQATFIVGLLFFLLGTFLSEATNKFYALNLNISMYLLILGLIEVVIRICLLVEETYHIPSRYANITELFFHAFHFAPEFLTVFILSFFMIVCFGFCYGNPVKLVYELGWSTQLCIFGAFLWLTLLRPKYGSLYQALSIGRINGLDFGSAMAYSLFHGYLNIVLPNKGDDHKGLKELIQDYEAKEQITFDYQKLIILIPLSLYCPPMMTQHSKIVESAKSLPNISIDRAGVNKRNYHCTTYKILDKKESKKIYVCAEYATPLLTLYNIISHRNEYANDYATQRKELALQFYLTLQSILDNDPDCKDCCDLIFYDDKKDGEFVDVGEVVLEHVNSKLKKIL